MAWPQPTDFNEAVQNPRACFSDSELQAGEVVTNTLGMPQPHSGNFADVYQIRGPGGQSWAVKCFTREVISLQSRYQLISEHLRQSSPPFMVQFHYLTKGIRIGANWFPVVKMDWVEGRTLNEFVARYVDNPQVMYRLAKMWVKLSLQLRRAKVAHADLQHGNVLLVPGEKASQLSLRLIDYDGMYVPALANSPSGEMGHPNYQHPQRLASGGYNSEVDRFPHLVIYAALRCLTVGGRELWDKHDNGENLLFREQDFRQPTESQLLLDLWQLPDPDVRRLLGILLLGSQTDLDRVAMLDDVVGAEGRPLGLTGGQERHLMDLLPPSAARMKVPPAIVSHFTLEELVNETDDEPLDAQWPRRGKLAFASPSGPNAATKAAPTLERSNSSNNRAGPKMRKTPAAREANHSAAAGQLLLPKARGRCRRCGEQKHLWESVCPSCQKVDWFGIALASIGCLVCLILAVIGLSQHVPGIWSAVGAVGALASIIANPLVAGLLVMALQGYEKVHTNAAVGLRWPALNEICPRCGGVNHVPLFCCRICGRVSWVRLVMLCTFAMTAAAMVAISQPGPHAPEWWTALAMIPDWIGRLLAAAAAFAIFIGTLEVWQLQSRLPKEGRIFRSLTEQAALLAATLLPLLCTALLVFGLFSHR